MSARAVRPELLDTLPPADPAALRSRRDLRRVNLWMAQARLMTRLLRQYTPGIPATIMELGCGDGTLMLRVARTLAPAWPAIRLTLVDRQSLVTPATLRAYADLGWHAEPHTADVFDALAATPERLDIVTTNLFLHHFEADSLRTLLARIATKTRFFAACEPARSRRALLASHLLWALGCNAVTRHDATTSVRAGFAGHDLSALFPASRAWRLAESPAGLFTHGFVAMSPEP